MFYIIRIPSICRTRFGFAVFRVKNIFDESLPKREPLRDGDCSKSAISKSFICFSKWYKFYTYLLF
jgi:hypothetical protein